MLKSLLKWRYFHAKIPEDAVTIPAKTRTEVGFELDIPESLWSTFLGGLGYTVYRIIIIGRPNSAIFAKEGVLCHKEIVIIGLVNSIRDGFVDEFNETKVNKYGWK